MTTPSIVIPDQYKMVMASPNSATVPMSLVTLKMLSFFGSVKGCRTSDHKTKSSGDQSRRLAQVLVFESQLAVIVGNGVVLLLGEFTTAKRERSTQWRTPQPPGRRPTYMVGLLALEESRQCYTMDQQQVSKIEAYDPISTTTTTGSSSNLVFIVAPELTAPLSRKPSALICALVR